MILQADLLVIGGGAAGVVAAVAAARRGARVLLCDGGASATGMSSGAVDLAADPSIAESGLLGPPSTLVDCVEELARQHPLHPYARIGASGRGRLAAALELLAELSGTVELSSPSGGRGFTLVSGLGMLRRVALAGQSQQRAALEGLAGARLGVAHLPEHYELDGRTLVAVLRSCLSSTPTERRPQALPVTVPFLRRARDAHLSSVEVARLLDDDLAVGALASCLQAALQARSRLDLLLGPGVIGLHRHREGLFRLQALAGLPIAELPGLSPSAPGLRLQLALTAALAHEGVEVVRGRILSLRLEPDEPLEAEVQERPGDASRKLCALRGVLATGHLAGGGLVAAGRLREALADLPLSLDGQALGARAATSLVAQHDADHHPLLRAGLATDELLRPLRADGKQPIHPQLYAAGAVLAGNDPTWHRAGIGLAALTGMVAGEAAAR